MKHTDYLLQALSLADSRRGFCSPNPAVGAIIVNNHKVIAEGLHFAAGQSHAEVDALSKLAPGESKSATLYVTLEPCCHQGKTPPCTDAIIQAGIHHVIYAYDDPNPVVREKSIDQLRAAKIRVTKISLPEIDQFYESYAYWCQHKKPLVTAKLALSLDAKIAGPKGATIRITGAELEQLTHHARLKKDAILTTHKTVESDDPLLNVRLFGTESLKPVYILDRRLQSDPTKRIFQTGAPITLLHASSCKQSLVTQWQERGVNCLVIQHDRTTLVLSDVMTKLGELGVHDLWVEAGGKLFESLIQEKLTHRAMLYIAAKTLGKNALNGFSATENIFQLAKSIKWEAIGDDVVCGIVF